MNSVEPARTAPTGAPRPLLRSIQIESKQPPKSAAGVPVATTALSSRAPSQWASSPSSWAGSVTACTCSSDQQLPPPRLDVCSIETRRAYGGGGLGQGVAAEADRDLGHPAMVSAGAPKATRDYGAGVSGWVAGVSGCLPLRPRIERSRSPISASAPRLVGS